MRMKSFIEIQDGSVVLESVNFEGVHTIDASALFGGVILQASSCKELVCGTLIYNGGTVSHLNNGFDYSLNIRFAPFLYARFMERVEINNVYFAHNFIVDAYTNPAKLSANGLLYLENFYNLKVNHCTFTKNFVSAGAIIVNSGVELPKFSHPKEYKAYVYEQSYIMLSNLQFESNLCEVAVINVVFGKDVLNTVMSTMTFLDNAIEGENFINIDNQNVVSEDILLGIYKTLLNPLSGVKENLWIAPRYINISDIHITETYSFQKLVNIRNLANVYLSNVTIEKCGDTDPDVLPRVFSSFASDIAHPLLPFFPSAAICSAFLFFDSSQQLSLSALNVTANSCSSGNCGVKIEGISGPASVSQYVTADNVCATATGLAFDCYFELIIGISHFTARNNSNELGEVALFGANSRVIIEDSICEDNTGIYGTVVYLSYIEEFTARRVVFRNNVAEDSIGGALYWWLGNSLSVLIILQDCVFSENSAERSGVLGIESQQNTSICLIIENCRFEGNKADALGSAIFVGRFLTFTDDSRIQNTVFESNIGTMGVVYLTHSGGQLHIYDSEFRKNKGAIVATLLIESDPGADTLIENVTFQDNSQGPTILKSNSRVNSTFITKNCRYINNEKADVVMEGGFWTDSYSIYSTSDESEILLSARAISQVSHSQFFSNYDPDNGGALHLMTASNFLCEYCLFVNNSAGLSGGVLFLEQESVTTLRHCVFRGNNAKGGGAVFYFASSMSKMSLVESSLIEGNDGGSSGVILSQTAAFTLKNVTIQYNKGISTSGIILLMSSIVINDSVFRGMRGSSSTFLGLYTNCTANITNSRFEDGECGIGGILYLSSSLLAISSTSFSNMTTREGGVISAYSDSLVFLSDVKITTARTQASGSLFDMSESSLTISRSQFRDYKVGGINAYQLSTVEITDSSFEQGDGQLSAAVYFYQCGDVRITSTSFRSQRTTQGGALFFEALEDKQLGQVTIQDCEFVGNHADTFAGAMYVRNHKVTITGGVFANNTAKDGGAIYIDCTIISMCNYTISGAHFHGNSAVVRGGALSWQSVKPTLTNLSFANNSASYGADIASFPVELRIDALYNKSNSRVLGDSSASLSEVYGVAPGQMVNTVIVASLRDHYGQIISTDNSSVGVVSHDSSISTVSVSGQTKVTASQGQFTIDNFIVFASANSTVNIDVSCSAISKVTAGDPDTHTPQVTLKFNMRDCVPGEFESPGNCNLCSEGTFSLHPANPCQTCLANAVCLGNFTIYPISGYWRSNVFSPVIRNCPSEASCLGGQQDGLPINLTGFCATGYKGNLCQSCVDGYSRAGKNKCSKCLARSDNIVRLTFIALAMLIGVVVMVWTSMRSATRPKATHSIMIRIFTNYLQLVTLVTEFKLSWPQPVLDFFSAQEAVGGATEQAYSIDCFLSSNSGSDVFYRKSIFMALLPMPLIIGSVLFWTYIAVRKNKPKVLTRECAATIVILFFLILPNLVKALFSMLSCTEIEVGEYWLTADMDIRCWDSAHTFYVLAVALPAIMLWVFGVPLACLAILTKYRSRQSELWMKLQYGFLINGYRRRCYYWEFVILYRKILIICCAVFLNNSISIQALTVQILLIASFFLQDKIKPYTTKGLNKLESWAIVVAAVTIYCGLYYLTKDITGIFSWILFFFIALANAIFIMYWLVGLLGYFIGLVSLALPAIGRILKPGRFQDPYIEDFVNSYSKCVSEATYVSSLSLQDCYRKMIGQNVTIDWMNNRKYIPRRIQIPTSAVSFAT